MSGRVFQNIVLQFKDAVDTEIGVIDAEGTVSFAGKTGTVTVTATSTDGSRISATVKLQVGVLTKSVTIGEPADHTLRSGKSLTLKATTDPVKPTVSGVTFKLVNASDSAYVSVSTSGKVSAKTVNEPHVVKIYAVSKDAAAVESNEITLTILPKNVQSLILKSGDKYVTNGKVVRNVNEELTLKAYTLDTTDGAVEETRDVTWTSSNTKVATIDETGKVTCVKTGTVKLTATADKKTKAAVTLKVTNLVNGITIVTKNDKDSMVVASGKSLALKAAVQPADASQKAVTWSNEAVKGSKRFLDRCWNLMDLAQDSDELSQKNEALIHKTIKKVSQDIDELKMNTAIAALMTMVNEFYANGCSKGDVEMLCLLLSPFAPHMVEEMWENMGFAAKYGKMAMQMPWPEYDESKTVAAHTEMAVQVNGKIRCRIKMPAAASKEEVEKTALSAPELAPFITGKTVRKVIVVKNVVNVVAN